MPITTDDERLLGAPLPRVRRVAATASAVGAVVAVTVLAGWWAGVPWLVTWGGVAAATPWTVVSLGLVAAATVVAGPRRWLLAGTATTAALVALVAPGAAVTVQQSAFDARAVSSPGTALAVVLLVGALAAGPTVGALRVGLVAGAVSLAHTAALGALLGVDWAVRAAAGDPSVGMSLPTAALVWTAAVAVWAADGRQWHLATRALVPAALAAAAAPWLVAAVVGTLEVAVWVAAAATSVAAALAVAMLGHARTHEEVLAGVRRLVEAAPDAMLLVDGDGIVVHANLPASNLFEHSLAEIVGSGVEALVPGASRNHHRDLRDAYTREPQTRMMDAGNVVHVERADGTRIPVSIALAPMRVGGDLLVAVTVRDVSQQEERVQALVQLERMQRLFMSAVSHELRTPLAIVQATADTLNAHRRALDEETIDLLVERLAANSRRLDGLLTDLLNLQRVERGELGEPRAITPAELVHMVTTSAREVDLDQCTVEHPPACPGVAADPVLLRRALHNLLHNASKYAPGPVEVTLEPSGAGVEIRVEDHGPGVPEQLRAGVFDPFRRGDQLDRATPGVGIGLSLVAGVATAAGGRAWVGERDDGRNGASFRLWLPADDDGATDDAAVVSSSNGA